MLIYRGIVLVWYNAVIICKEDFPLDENKDKTLSGGNDESYGSTFDRNTEDVKKEMEELAAEAVNKQTADEVLEFVKAKLAK